MRKSAVRSRMKTRVTATRVHEKSPLRHRARARAREICLSLGISQCSAPRYSSGRDKFAPRERRTGIEIEAFDTKCRSRFQREPRRKRDRESV